MVSSLFSLLLQARVGVGIWTAVLAAEVLPRTYPEYILGVGITDSGDKELENLGVCMTMHVPPPKDSWD